MKQYVKRACQPSPLMFVGVYDKRAVPNPGEGGADVRTGERQEVRAGQRGPAGRSGRGDPRTCRGEDVRWRLLGRGGLGDHAGRGPRARIHPRRDESRACGDWLLGHSGRFHEQPVTAPASRRPSLGTTRFVVRGGTTL